VSNPTDPTELRLSTRSMGTRFELVADGGDAARLRAVAEEALHEIERLDADLSRFRRGSLIRYVNDHASVRPVALDAETFEILTEALAIARATDHAFDPTQGPRMRAHGFWREDGPVDAPTGAAGIELDPERRSVKFRRAVELDLGAIAKGHAVDVAIETLVAGGASRALLHGGTSAVRAFGSSADADGWPVAIADPGGGAGWRVELCDSALAVSAPHGRSVQQAGAELGHVIDPRTGYPASGVALAAVVGPSARVCDAWSTALVVDPKLSLPEDYSALVLLDGDSDPRCCGRDRSPFRALERRPEHSSPIRFER